MQNEYKINDIIECIVTGIEKYGIFVKVDDNYSGLIHISEVSKDFVKDIHDYVSLGEIIYCQVLEVDNDTNQIKLSIKDINYKKDNTGYLNETRRGFLPLKESLNNWIDNYRNKDNE